MKNPYIGHSLHRRSSTSSSAMKSLPTSTGDLKAVQVPRCVRELANTPLLHVVFLRGSVTARCFEVRRFPETSLCFDDLFPETTQQLNNKVDRHIQRHSRHLYPHQFPLRWKSTCGATILCLLVEMQPLLLLLHLDTHRYPAPTPLIDEKHLEILEKSSRFSNFDLQFQKKGLGLV